MSDVDNITKLSSFKRERRKLNGTGGAEKRVVIRIEIGNLEQAVDQAEAALIASDRGLFQRADRIVSTGKAKRAAADKSEIQVVRILERGEHALMEDLTVVADFEKYDGRSGSFVPTDVPPKIVKVLRERVGRLRFPPLDGVITAPTLRQEGTLIDKPGYDPESGLLLLPGDTQFPQIPEAPTRQDAEKALGILKGLIASFPFITATDRAVALSALLTAPIRRSLRTAPMHAYTAPVAGSGKSMLADLASILATGREAAVIAQGRSEEESEKRLGSILLAGDQAVSIDNCEGQVGGEFLCAMLTQSSIRVRVLGKSEAPELPTGVFITATGNNLCLAGDMTRRALLCQLDPEVERPELRRFDSNPIAEAKANRGAYVAAILTALRGYIVAGRPKQADPLGSFAEWSDLVRSTLLWLGESDPVASMETARARDPRLDELHAVVSQWAEVIGTEKMTVRNVIAKATEKSAPNGYDFNQASFLKPDFRESLLAVAGVGGAINSRKLGTWIGRQKKRIVSVISDPTDTNDGTEFPQPKRKPARWRFQSGPMQDGFATWYLEDVSRPVAPATEFAERAR